MSDSELKSALVQLTLAVNQLTMELKAGRRKEVVTRRVKAVRRAARSVDVPVSDIAAAAARRALARTQG